MGCCISRNFEIKKSNGNNIKNATKDDKDDREIELQPIYYDIIKATQEDNEWYIIYCLNNKLSQYIQIHCGNDFNVVKIYRPQNGIYLPIPISFEFAKKIITNYACKIIVEDLS